MLLSKVTYEIVNVMWREVMQNIYKPEVDKDQFTA